MSRDAAASYAQPTKRGGSPRETEGRALLEAARRLLAVQEKPEDREAFLTNVRLNWRLWTIFQAELTTPDNQMPIEIRQNMLNLCNFVDKRTVEILADPKPALLTVLININRNIAAGLLADPTADNTSAVTDDDQPQAAGATARGISV